MIEVRQNLRKVAAGAACLAESEAVIAVESETISKNGVIPKDQMSRGNLFNKMKKTSEILLFVLLIVLYNSCNYMSKDKAIGIVANTIVFENRCLTLQPMTVEDGVIAYKAEYINDGNIVKYYYKCVNTEKSYINSMPLTKKMNEERMKKKQINVLKSVIKDNNTTKIAFVVAEITFMYIYEDKNGDKIFEMVITPEEYK